MRFSDIVVHGNRGFHRKPVTGAAGALSSAIVCADGFSMSVIAGAGTYCTPRPELCSCGLGAPYRGGDGFSPDDWGAAHDYPGPYTHVEVGFPSERPEPWSVWQQYVEDPDRPTDTVYAYVPTGTVYDLILLHGGEVGKEDVSHG